MKKNSTILSDEQLTILKLIFPFRMQNIKINKFLKKIRKSDNFVDDKDFISPDSRHFDHIEELAIGDQRVIHAFDYKISTNKTDDCFYQFLSDFYNKNAKKAEQTKIDFENLKYIIKKFKVLIFDSGIFFVIFECKSTRKHKMERYFEDVYNIKRYFKNIIILDLISKIFGIKKKNFYSFDSSQNIYKDGVQTNRFQMFFDIWVNSNNKVMDESKVDLLANYCLNRNCVEKITVDKIVDFQSRSMFASNYVYSSTESCVSITFENNFNRDLIHATQFAVQQNLFFDYMLVLHQYYYLHYIAKKTQNLNINNLNIKNKLDLILAEFSTLNTKYFYLNVSQFYYVQNIYNSFLDSYSIKNYIEEVSESIEPLSKILNSKTTTSLDFLIKVLGLTSIAGSLINLYNFIWEWNNINDPNYDLNVMKMKFSGSLTVISIIIFIILIIIRSFSFKQLINKNKKKKI